MGITVMWDNEQHSIIRYVFECHWTWDDFQVARELVYKMIDAETHTVALLFDVPRDVSIPPNFVSKFATMFRHKHPRTCAMVVVGGNPYVRALVGVLASVADKSGNTLRAFYLQDQAYAWLEQRHPQPRIQLQAAPPQYASMD